MEASLLPPVGITPKIRNRGINLVTNLIQQSADLKATAILSQRETWVRAVSVVAWPQYTQDFLKDHSGLTGIERFKHHFNSAEDWCTRYRI